MKIYLVKKNADMTEGRGPMVVVAAFTHEDDAWAVADTMSGVMGRKPKSGTWRDIQYGDVMVEPLEVNESAAAFVRKQEDDLRNKALAKLSEAEKRALGLI